MSNETFCFIRHLWKALLHQSESVCWWDPADGFSRTCDDCWLFQFCRSLCWHLLEAQTQRKERAQQSINRKEQIPTKCGLLDNLVIGDITLTKNVSFLCLLCIFSSLFQDRSWGFEPMAVWVQGSDQSSEAVAQQYGEDAAHSGLEGQLRLH